MEILHALQKEKEFGRKGDGKKNEDGDAPPRRRRAVGQYHAYGKCWIRGW